MLESLKTIGFAISALARPYRGRRRVEAYQLRRLQGLVRHAAARIPYYRELFDRAALKPEDIRCLDDLQRLPMTGKRQLREQHQSMLDPQASARHLIEHKTSGSTGVPVRINRTLDEERRLNLLRWRMLLMLGLRPGDRMALVKTTWESPPVRFERLRNLAKRIRLVDRRVFDCFLPPTEAAQRLADYRPHLLVGYPGTLLRIGAALSARERAHLAPRTVLCGGEWLAPLQRRRLGDYFRVPVYDTYGTTECNLAAWECPKTGLYHVCDDGLILEICRDGVPVAPGEPGEVVITSLHSHAMPLIRVQLGDLAVAGPSPCPCGSPFSTLRQIQGRSTDFLPLPDGRRLHPFELLNPVVLVAGDWIAEYQVIQERLDLFRVTIVPSRRVSDDETARLRNALQEVVGLGVQVRVEQVGAVPGAANGKFHFCRSLVAPDGEAPAP